MSETYQTEEEQIEALKKWWRENGKSTLLSIAVAIAAVFGWQGWQQQQQDEVHAASALYQNLLTTVTANDGVLTDEQLATSNHLAETIKQDFPKSTYAQFAAFFKAQLAVKAADLDLAEQELRWVLASQPSAEVSAQASLRLARVLYAKDQSDEALALLNVEPLGYGAAFEELKGDIYHAKGDTLQAKTAYEKAQALSADSSNPLLGLKLEQLAVVEG